MSKLLEQCSKAVGDAQPCRRTICWGCSGKVPVAGRFASCEMRDSMLLPAEGVGIGGDVMGWRANRDAAAPEMETPRPLNLGILRRHWGIR